MEVLGVVMDAPPSADSKSLLGPQAGPSAPLMRFPPLMRLAAPRGLPWAAPPAWSEPYPYVCDLGRNWRVTVSSAEDEFCGSPWRKPPTVSRGVSLPAESPTRPAHGLSQNPSSLLAGVAYCLMPHIPHEEAAMKVLARSSVLALAVAASAAVQGQSPCLEELLASDPGTTSQFGTSVALDGDRMLIGAEGAAGVASSGGAVYVFERTPTGWFETAKFFPSDGVVGQFFGGSVALHGDRAVVGAVGDYVNGPQSGAAYVFELVGGSWVQVVKLRASDGSTYDRFGWSVHLNGDIALIGAPFTDLESGSLEENHGSAYFFERLPTGWVETQKLQASNASVSAKFGMSVAVQGGRALIGAPVASSPLGAGLGAAYIFELTGNSWTETDLLFDPAATLITLFGVSVALDGNTAVIGAIAGSGIVPHSGAAHVFTDTASGWTYQAKLVASDFPSLPGFSTAFGASLSINGNSVVIGAYADDEAGPNAGAAYYFERSGSVWTEIVKLFAVSPQSNDQFGAAVTIDAQRAVVGAENHTILLPGGPPHLGGAGVAVAFDLACPIGSNYCTPALPNSTGQPADIRATGSETAGNNFVRLTASLLPHDQFGYFLVSRDQGFVNPPGSTGLLCLGGDIGRYNCTPCGQVQSSGATGSMSIGRPEGLDLENLPLNVPPLFTSPGDTLNFQCWYRDFNPILTSNFTDGVSVLFQ